MILHVYHDGGYPMVLKLRKIISPHSTHDISLHASLTPTVLSIPYGTQDIPRIYHDVPHGTEQTPGIKISPTFIMISPTVLNTPMLNWSLSWQVGYCLFNNIIFTLQNKSPFSILMQYVEPCESALTIGSFLFTQNYLTFL